MILATNIAGLLLFIFVIWWFWLSSPHSQKVNSKIIDVIVDNGVYTPSPIEVKQGQELILRFIRKDASPCAEKVIFESWNLSADLPVEQGVKIKIPTEEKGEFTFTCQMQMYRGLLKVI